MLPRLWRQRHDQADRCPKSVSATSQRCPVRLAAGPGVSRRCYRYGRHPGCSRAAARRFASGSGVAASGHLLGRDAGAAKSRGGSIVLPAQRPAGQVLKITPGHPLGDVTFAPVPDIGRRPLRHCYAWKEPMIRCALFLSASLLAVPLVARAEAPAPTAAGQSQLDRSKANSTRCLRRLNQPHSQPLGSVQGQATPSRIVQPLPCPWRASCAGSGHVQARCLGCRPSCPEGRQQPLGSARR